MHKDSNSVFIREDIVKRHDTRIFLHSIEMTIVIHSRDTDVLVVFLGDYQKMTSTQLWLKTTMSHKI